MTGGTWPKVQMREVQGGLCGRPAHRACEEVRCAWPTGPCSGVPAHQTAEPGSGGLWCQIGQLRWHLWTSPGALSRRGAWPHPGPMGSISAVLGPGGLSPRLSSLSPTSAIVQRAQTGACLQRLCRWIALQFKCHNSPLGPLVHPSRAAG